MRFDLDEASVDVLWLAAAPHAMVIPPEVKMKRSSRISSGKPKQNEEVKIFLLFGHTEATVWSHDCGKH